jgi:hypothetical protein
MGREGLELSSGISPIAVHRPRQPATLPSARIRTSLDPELVGVTPPLSNRTLGRIHCHIHCHSVLVVGN